MRGLSQAERRILAEAAAPMDHGTATDEEHAMYQEMERLGRCRQAINADGDPAWFATDLGRLALRVCP